MNEVTPAPSATSWEFWKKRLARIAILLGLALLATQVLPSLPTEQNVLILAPQGHTLRQVSLSYADRSDGRLLAGVELHPISTPNSNQSGASVAHSLRLTNGDYQLIVASEAGAPNGTTVFLNHIQELHFDGTPQKVQLTAP